MQVHISLKKGRTEIVVGKDDGHDAIQAFTVATHVHVAICTCSIKISSQKHGGLDVTHTHTHTPSLHNLPAVGDKGLRVEGQPIAESVHIKMVGD